MSKEFKIVITDNEDSAFAVSITSTGWNSLELAGIISRLPDLIQEALREEEVLKEDEIMCACGESRVCECESSEDASDEE